MASTSEQYASDLYAALVQFFHLFPEYLQRDFYVAGISYGGKFIDVVEKSHIVQVHAVEIRNIEESSTGDDHHRITVFLIVNAVQ
jgi:vitellogenic carboxypeptidase-like protein